MPKLTDADRASAIFAGKTSAAQLVNAMATKLNDGDLSIGFAIGAITGIAGVIEFHMGAAYAAATLSAIAKDARTRIPVVQQNGTAKKNGRR